MRTQQGPVGLRTTKSGGIEIAIVAHRLTGFLLAAGLIAAVGSAGAANPPIPIPRSSGKIVVDGVVDEPAWEDAARLGIPFEVEPGENLPAPVTTDVRLTWDADHILVAFRCFDPNPEAIRARFSDRDLAWSDDWVGIVLDTFNDQRRAYELVTNPLGVQIDALNDEANGRYDVQWNAIWTSAGRLTATGYEVEMAIPFNQIRFQRKDGPQVWGLDLMRSYPRTQRHHIGLFPRDRGNNSYLGQTVKIVGFEAARSGRTMEIVPTLTGSARRSRPDFPAGAFDQAETTTDVGVTGAWSVSPNITLAAAVNPDFSQVEADSVLLDINETFALYLPETRPFFQLGADYFQTGLRLVHTRAIAEPDGALKAVGKAGPHTYGIFSARDAVTNMILPGAERSDAATFDEANTASVGRYRFDFGGNSTVGVIGTDRSGSGGYHNRLIGGDLRLRVGQHDTLDLEVAWSRTDYSRPMADEFDLEQRRAEGHALAVEYRHTERNWGGDLWYREFDEGFRSDLGFRPNVGVRQGGGFLERYWWADGDRWYNRLELGVGWDYGQRRDGFSGRSTNGWFNFKGPYQSSAGVSVSSGSRVFEGAHFSTDGYSVYGSWTPHHAFQCGLSLDRGDWIDFDHGRPADRWSVAPWIGLRPGRHLSLDLAHDARELHVEPGRLFAAGVTELRGVWQFNLRLLVRMILQYTDIDRSPLLYDEPVDRETRRRLVQLLFSYKVNPRTVVYLGYTDGASGSEWFPVKTEDQVIFAKVGYAFLF